MASQLFPAVEAALIAGTFDWAGGVVRAVLLPENVAGVSELEVLADIPAGSRIAVSEPVEGRAVNNGWFTANPIKFTAVFDPRRVFHVVFFRDTGVEETSTLIALVHEADIVGDPILLEGVDYYLYPDAVKGGFFFFGEAPAPELSVTREDGSPPSLSWVSFAPDSPMEIRGFVVYRRIGTAPFVPIAELPATVNHYIDGSAPDGELAYYLVQQVDVSAIRSLPDQFDVVSDTVLLLPDVPVLVPPSLSAVQTETGPILVTWTAADFNGPPVSSYHLYRKRNAGSFDLIATLDAETLEYTDNLDNVLVPVVSAALEITPVLFDAADVLPDWYGSISVEHFTGYYLRPAFGGIADAGSIVDENMGDGWTFNALIYAPIVPDLIPEPFLDVMMRAPEPPDGESFFVSITVNGQAVGVALEDSIFIDGIDVYAYFGGVDELLLVDEPNEVIASFGQATQLANGDVLTYYVVANCEDHPSLQSNEVSVTVVADGWISSVDQAVYNDFLLRGYMAEGFLSPYGFPLGRLSGGWFSGFEVLAVYYSHPAFDGGFTLIVRGDSTPPPDLFSSIELLGRTYSTDGLTEASSMPTIDGVLAPSFGHGNSTWVITGAIGEPAEFFVGEAYVGARVWQWTGLDGNIFDVFGSGDPEFIPPIRVVITM